MIPGLSLKDSNWKQKVEESPFSSFYSTVDHFGITSDIQKCSLLNLFSIEIISIMNCIFPIKSIKIYVSRTRLMSIDDDVKKDEPLIGIHKVQIIYTRK